MMPYCRQRLINTFVACASLLMNCCMEFGRYLIIHGMRYDIDV